MSIFKGKGTTWPCWFLGHRIEVIWADDRNGRCVLVCVRCGERHCYELNHAKWES